MKFLAKCVIDFFLKNDKKIQRIQTLTYFSSIAILVEEWHNSRLLAFLVFAATAK
jgi:hypothetical protein